MWHVLSLFIHGPEACCRILQRVLLCWWNHEWNACGTDCSDQCRLSNQMVDSLIQITLLLFHFTLSCNFQTLWQQQGIYPHTQSMNPSPHRSPFYQNWRPFQWHGVNIQSVEHQVASSSSIHPANPVHGWPQVVTSRDCKAACSLKRSNTARGWQLLNKIFKISNGAGSQMTKDISCNQIRQFTFMCTYKRLTKKMQRYKCRCYGWLAFQPELRWKTMHCVLLALFPNKAGAISTKGRLFLRASYFSACSIPQQSH